MSRSLVPNRERRAPTSAPAGLSGDEPCACRIALRGKVQGLGVRPAIARLAHDVQVTGSVSNSSGGVSIHVEGPSSRLQAFLKRLTTSLPIGAVVEAIETENCPPIGEAQFRIARSASDGPIRARVPPDVAVCRDCLAETTAADNRRRGYVFTTCTHCGPRYSLVESMPYDRAATGMARFTMCPRCRDEYARAADRRFHSQTNSCQRCGPRMWLSDGAGAVIAQRDNALDRAVTALRSGQIVALRGVGGYQLIVDGTSDSAVRRLRRRKRRNGKPMAVMVADRAAAERLAVVDDVERSALAAPENPIVVLRSRAGANLAPSVSDSLDTIGLMLPATPLHDRLARATGRPLVVTSGNVEGEPLAFDLDAAQRELSNVADVWLHHDRPIVRPIDDSVVRVVAGRAATVRLARGLAPLSLNLETRHRVVALGGHQKAAIALTGGAQAVLGPHVGDLETEASRRRYIHHVEQMCRLYDVEPQWLVHDEHPEYFTTQWAAQQPVATMAVQHHHAHVVAGMLQRGWLDRTVLGVAWDGTGYGPDGTIWGGEFLIATAAEYRRVGWLRPFSLPGAQTAVRQPWRVAVALVADTLGLEAAAKLQFDGVAARQVEQLACLAQKRHLCPQTSSAGRLFDAVAALVLNVTRSDFEGQPAMMLEAACDRSAAGQYELTCHPTEPSVLDWRPLVRGVLADLHLGAAPGAIAMRFHRTAALGISAMAQRFPELPVVLGGGCFQNRVLAELVAERLEASRRPVETPGVIPTNDGGLAAGQLAVAVARLEGGHRPCV